MMRGIATVGTFISVIIFPWPFAATLAFVTAFSEPLVPLAAGLFTDTLYYTHVTGSWPVFTLSGAGVTIIASVVHRRLRTSTMGR